MQRKYLGIYIYTVTNDKSTWKIYMYNVLTLKLRSESRDFKKNLFTCQSFRFTKNIEVHTCLHTFRGFLLHVPLII